MAPKLNLGIGPNLAYDYLSIDVGIEPALTDLAEFDAALVPVKPISGFMARFNLVYEQYRGGGAFAIVGAGAAGLELAFALNHRFGDQGRKKWSAKTVLYLSVPGCGGTSTRGAASTASERSKTRWPRRASNFSPSFVRCAKAQASWRRQVALS